MQPTTPSKPLTIVHTEASTGWGGQEIRIWQEARWFRQRGDRVILVGPRDSLVFQRFQGDQFETYAFPFGKGAQWFDIVRLNRLLVSINPDVLGTHSSRDSWAALLGGMLARVPVRLRYRHVSAPVHPHVGNRFLYGRAAGHVITTAECIRQKLIGELKLPGSRVTTVATGIQPATFATDRETERARIASSLGLPDSTRFVGCVAVLRSWKAQDVLMQAFDGIAARIPRHHLLLVGGGSGHSWLESVRSTLSARARIHLLGHQENPWPFFRAFDLAVLPSYKDEGIPQSLLQAMFAECPVIGTTVGGIPEIVEHGKTGLLVPPKVVPDLGNAILETISSPENSARRAQNALAFVMANHTLEGMGRRLLSIVGSFRRETPRLPEDHGS